MAAQNSKALGPSLQKMTANIAQLGSGQQVQSVQQALKPYSSEPAAKKIKLTTSGRVPGVCRKCLEYGFIIGQGTGPRQRVVVGGKGHKCQLQGVQYERDSGYRADRWVTSGELRGKRDTSWKLKWDGVDRREYLQMIGRSDLI